MSKDFPDRIDPWKAGEGQRIYNGSIALAKMPRLAPLLAEPGGEAAFSAAFSLDREKRALIDLEVGAELPLVCQASMEHYLHPVRCRSRLMVVETELQGEALTEHFDTTLAADGRVDFADLVEDELLLALPQVPRKPELEEVTWNSGPGSTSHAGPVETYKPFAGLESLIDDLRAGRKSGKN